MSVATVTPADLNIHVRHLAFGRDAPAPRWWLGGDPVATAFYNALSITFPQGERFFMDSVRRYRPLASPALDGQIEAFLAQEATHTREHLAFNHQVAANGYDVTAMDARTHATLSFTRRRPDHVQLASTIALEHFTAILAHALLADPRHLQGASEEAAAMWRWHAIEELEHKAVAFDTFVAATADWPRHRRWLLRVLTMAGATWLLFLSIGRNIGDLFAQDGVGVGAWRRLGGFLFFTPGILRQILSRYLTYFRPGFHPWEHDDRALIAAAEASLALRGDRSAAA